MTTFKSGAKSSEAAPRYDLIPKCALDRLADRLAFGAERHGENNYQKGANDPEYIRDRVNHLVGHALKLAAGHDDEDHLAAIMANCAMLAWFDQQKAKGYDDARLEREKCRCGKMVNRPEQCDGPPCPFDRWHNHQPQPDATGEPV